MKHPHSAAIATVLLAGALLAAMTGCAGTGTATGVSPGASPKSTTASQGPVNAEDVMFLQMMIPHHRQAIEIARLADAKAAHPEVKTLAQAMAATKATEIHAMTERLYSWDQPISVGADAHAAHGGLPETTEKQMAALRAAKQREFDGEFLNLLIAHHDDAVQLADTEITKGANPATVEQARNLKRGLTAQIDHMITLLTEVEGSRP